MKNMESFFERAGNSQLIIIPGDELPENMEEFLNEGLHRIITLCNEGIKLLKDDGVTSRVCDILADEIPTKSESLFDVVFRWRDASVRNLDDTAKNKVV